MTDMNTYVHSVEEVEAVLAFFNRILNPGVLYYSGNSVGRTYFSAGCTSWLVVLNDDYVELRSDERTAVWAGSRFKEAEAYGAVAVPYRPLLDVLDDLVRSEEGQRMLDVLSSRCYVVNNPLSPRETA